MRRIIAQRPPAAITAALAAIILSACGAGSPRPPAAGPTRPTAGPTRPSAGPSPTSAAGPITTASTGWPALLHGPSHYGASTSVGPASSRVRWRRDLGGPIVAGPIITSAGTAYVGSGNGVLHAIDVATGRDRWTFDGGGSYGSDLSTAALVLSSGEILWPGPRQRLFALTATGRVLWTLPGGADLLTPALDSPAGLLVVADQAGRISGYRLGSGTAAPQRVWSRTLASMSYGNPVVAADGTIYQTAGDALFALSPSGHIRWTVTTPATIEVSPAVGVNGIVVFGANDSHEYGVNPDGHMRWKEKIGNYTYSSPLTLPGRRVVYGNHSGQMTILNSDTGQVVSRDSGQGQLWTAAAVDARRDVSFASRTGHIYGFDSAGRRLFDVAAGGTFDSYPALAPDGTLLIGDDNGTLFALR